MFDKVLKIAGATVAVVGTGFGLTKMYLNISKEKAITDAVRRESDRAVKESERILARCRAEQEQRERELHEREVAAQKAHEDRLRELDEARQEAERKATLRVAELEEELMRNKATPKTTKPRKPRNARNNQTQIDKE